MLLQVLMQTVADMFFYNIDKLLVLGQVDIEILKKLKKLKSSFMGLPKKIYSAGHTRSD